MFTNYNGFYSHQKYNHGICIIFVVFYYQKENSLTGKISLIYYHYNIVNDHGKRPSVDNTYCTHTSKSFFINFQCMV